MCSIIKFVLEWKNRINEFKLLRRLVLDWNDNCKKKCLSVVNYNIVVKNVFLIQ